MRDVEKRRFLLCLNFSSASKVARLLIGRANLVSSNLASSANWKLFSLAVICVTAILLDDINICKICPKLKILFICQLKPLYAQKSRCKNGR